MNDIRKTKEQLIQELRDLRRRIAELEKSGTERKRAEEDLHKSEERYRTILEDIDEGYFENDLAGNFTFVNDAECRDLGYPREELIGMSYRQYSDEATAKNLYELFYNIYNTGTPVKRFPGQFISKDGTRHFNEVSASLIRDAKGKPIGFRGVSRDITDRKRAEEKLRESEEKYRNILENIEDGYFEVDLAGNFTFFNPSICRILGYPREEMTGMNNRVFMDAENAKKVFRAFNEVYVTGIPTKGFEWETIRKDGTRAYIEVSLSLIVRSGEKPTGFRGIARDVTERKEAEQKLKESEEEYRQLFQNANEAIFVAQDGKLVFLNPMAIKMIGYSGEGLMSRSFVEFIHQDDRNMVIDRHIRRMKGEEVPHLYSFRIIQRNGSIKWAELNSVLIQWKKKAATLNFLTDITDRKQAEEALETLSLRDDLTGLFNRRGFFTLAEQGLKTAQRMGTEMLLIFGDLDNLKGINDNFGHKEGDQALMDISQILKETFRESDIIARIGGDEFVILAMNGLETSAEKLINRFEQTLNDHPLQTKRPYTLSLSLGITCFNPQNPCSIEVLLTEADKIMYENKQKKSR